MNNTKKNIEISEYILKYVSKKASEKEKKELKEWLMDEYNREVFDSLEDSQVISKDLEFLEKYSSSDYIEKVNLNLRKKRIRRIKRNVLRIAASIIILMGVSLAYYNLGITEKDFTKIANNEGLSHGESKAMLYMSSGEKVILDKDAVKKIISEVDGSKINLSKDSIVYNRDVENKLKDKPVYNTIVVPINGEYFATLSDGTKVWINADTKLKFPVTFSKMKREVYLEGEAYFEVKKDNKRPFIVKTTSSNIRVLGTGFNIKSYKGELESTTLVHGKVKVSDNFNNTVVLNPGEQAIIKGNNIEVTEVETMYYTAWKDGFFMFKDTRVEDILMQLSRWYGFEYFYQNRDVAEIKITTMLKRFDSFDKIIEILEQIDVIKLNQKGRTVIVSRK